MQGTFKHIGVEGKRFAPELETAAFRSVQEALTDVVRRAKVSDITVRAWADANGMTLQIEDHGEAHLGTGTRVTAEWDLSDDLDLQAHSQQ